LGYRKSPINNLLIKKLDYREIGNSALFIQRPRDRKIVTTKEFINYKEELLEALR